MEHDADHRVDGARRQALALGEEVAGRVVDQHVERAVLPDRIGHSLDRLGVADVADVPGGPAEIVRVELGHGFLEHLLAPAADDQLGA